MAFIGNTVQTQGFTPATDTFSGNGSTTAFTLSRPVASVQQIEAVISNVVQDPNSAYTVSGNTITFTSAPPSGTNNIYVRYTSLITQVIQPSQSTVGWNQLTTDVQQDLGISFKNRIINGAMLIDQRNAGASVSFSSSFAYYLDRFGGRLQTSTGSTIQQSTIAPTGFTRSLLVTIGTGASASAAQLNAIYQAIEGFNVADLGWGTANAKTVTMSFWVRSSLTGTFGGAFQNNANNRSYPFTYTISSANTWEQKTITVAGDTTGTWETTNNAGLTIWLNLGSGSNYQGTANSWAGADYRAPTGATSVVGTSGATFYITGVQLEVGTQATTFDYRSYGTELALCQRYYAVLLAVGINQYQNTGSCYNASLFFFNIKHPVNMRAAPTITNNSATAYVAVNNATPAITNWPAFYPSIQNSGIAATASITAGYAGHVDISSGSLTASAEL